MEERRRAGGHDPSEFRLSHESARAVTERTGTPRPRRTFLSTDHLSIEAAAAYVDGRLPPAGLARAETHLGLCDQCRREVEGQRAARRALRGSGPIHMPADLRDRLRELEETARRTDGVRRDAGDPDPDPDDVARPPGIWTRLVRRLRGSGR